MFNQKTFSKLVVMIVFFIGLLLIASPCLAQSDTAGSDATAAADSNPKPDTAGAASNAQDEDEEDEEDEEPDCE